MESGLLVVKSLRTATSAKRLVPGTLNFRMFRAFVGGMLRAVMLLGNSSRTVAVSQPLEYPKAKKK